jgi:hypothetical protein
MNFNLLDGIPKVDGLFPLELRGWSGITSLYPSGLLDFLGVSHMSSRTNALEWVERGSFLPMITAGQKPEFVETEVALKRMFSPGFTPQREVFLPPEARGEVGERRVTAARILSTSFSSHKITVEVEAEAETSLVIAQVHYHRWKAYLDGKEAPLWKANTVFQAIAVPGGRHQVTLVYKDRLFLAGATVSALCWAGCLGAWWWFNRRSRPGPSQGAICT